MSNELSNLFLTKEEWLLKAFANGDFFEQDIDQMIDCALENGDVVEVSILAKIYAEILMSD